MFISLKKLIIGKNDDTTYVSVNVLDPMQQPEETFRLDKNDLEKWIQVGLKYSEISPKNCGSSIACECVVYPCLSYHEWKRFSNFHPWSLMHLSIWSLNVVK